MAGEHGARAVQLHEQRPHGAPGGGERAAGADGEAGQPVQLDQTALAQGAVTGPDRRVANIAFQALGIPITVRTRHTYVAGCLALLVVDWVIDGPGPDGTQVHLEGTATDVARRGHDGLWCYVMDNPFGTAG
ncbi:DUF4440 domain-containing protein [Streptomyces sp. NPDC049915]|uniref:DUF4440 domain-containing protein n=1 Tax=Streptomyces sp. NPDC049915 TaxID=3155510 RepID=UPI003424B3B6